MGLLAPAGALRVTKNIADITIASLMSERYASLAMKYGFYAKGAEFIQGASKLALPADIIVGLGKVAAAEQGSKMQTMFEETGRINGGSIGALVSTAEGIVEEIAMPVISTPVAVAGIVIQVSAGAALGKEAGHDLYVYGGKAIHYMHEKYQPN